MSQSCPNSPLEGRKGHSIKSVGDRESGNGLQPGPSSGAGNGKEEMSEYLKKVEEQVEKQNEIFLEQNSLLAEQSERLRLLEEDNLKLRLTIAEHVCWNDNLTRIMNRMEENHKKVMENHKEIMEALEANRKSYIGNENLTEESSEVDSE